MKIETKYSLKKLFGTPEITYFYFLNRKEENISQICLLRISKEEYEMCDVFTAKKYRNKGLATKLINLVCKNYSGFNIRLYIDPFDTENTTDNNFDKKAEIRLKKLTAFYERFGFCSCYEPETMIRRKDQA